MNYKQGFCIIASVLAVNNVMAAGFGLYQASVDSFALGGAVVGKAVDASANFHNPATLSDLTNITVTVGVITETPYADMRVKNPYTGLEGKSHKMFAGTFWLPHLQIAIPLPYRFTFGLGIMPEYGLGSKYSRDWELANSSTETTVTSFTINPNLAFAITDDWSIGAGLKFVFFDFEQYAYPLSPAYGFEHRLKGDNGMKDLSWQVGTRYKILDNLSVGVVYKAKTLVHVEGKSQAQSAYLKAYDGSAETELMLPQSITAGFNWDITKTVHLGGVVAWTEWSSVDVLDFNLNGNHVPKQFNWCNTWRLGVAPSWDFAENWSLLGSYVYENDCTDDQVSTMLPAANRHMLALGLRWRVWENFDISGVYSLIIMDGKESNAEYPKVLGGGATSYAPYDGFSHALGISLTYRF